MGDDGCRRLNLRRPGRYVELPHHDFEEGVCITTSTCVVSWNGGCGGNVNDRGPAESLQYNGYG